MISAVVLTKNEEYNILQCLNSLNWCDEILIIDDHSDDKTLKLVEGLNNKKIRTFTRLLQENFSSQRNFALDKARFEWVLFIDADEMVSESLQYEIVNTINTSLENISGFYIRRIDCMWGRKLRFGELKSVKILRLARKDKGEWIKKVHEEWKVRGKISTLKNHLIHYPHPDIETFLKDINFYTDLRASELFSKGRKTDVKYIVIYPVFKFIYNYFIKLGLLDGVPGLIVAIVMSFHSFLVRGKLWKLWEEKKFNS